MVLANARMDREREAMRDAVVREHLPLIRQIASKVGGAHARYDGSFDDLMSAGMMGLLSAFDAFDSGRGVAFGSYAAPRVRGAILDEMRRQDFAPRSVRKKARQMQKARAAVSRRNGGSASTQEVADELGIPVATLWRWERDSAAATPEALDATSSSAESPRSFLDRLNFPTAESPDAALEAEESVEQVRAAIARLPEQERLVLILCYYEELKLRQVGEIIGVSESRVSQIRSRALLRLREELRQEAA